MEFGAERERKETERKGKKAEEQRTRKVNKQTGRVESEGER